jgi:hypothetical protein
MKMMQLFMLAAVTAVSIDAHARVIETTHHDVVVAAAPKVVVESRGGGIDIQPGPAGKVTVEARRAADTREEALALDVKVVSDGNGARITFQAEHRGTSVEFVIRAPADSHLVLSTGGGGVQVGAFTAAATVRTGGGGIRVEGLKGDLQLRTGGGGIKVERTEGKLEAETGGGGIDVSDAKLKGDNRLSTGGGGVHCRFLDATRLSIDATTGGGTVSNSLGLPQSDRQHLSGKLGDGKDGTLRIHTGGGGISLSKL